jgi:hypothetical protein
MITHTHRLLAASGNSLKRESAGSDRRDSRGCDFSPLLIGESCEAPSRTTGARSRSNFRVALVVLTGQLLRSLGSVHATSTWLTAETSSISPPNSRRYSAAPRPAALPLRPESAAHFQAGSFSPHRGQRIMTAAECCRSRPPGCGHKFMMALLPPLLEQDRMLHLVRCVGHAERVI